MSASARPPTIVLRPLGSAVPLGLTGLSVASLMAAGLALGWVPKSDAPHVGLLVFATVVPMQAIAAIFALLARDTAAATTSGTVAATWAVTGAAHLSDVPGGRDHVLGLAVLGGGVLILLSASAVVQSSLLPGIAMLLAGTHFVLMGLYDLGGTPTWKDIAGIVGLATFAAGALAAAARERRDTDVPEEPGVSAHV
jgi:hypothetical protein